MTSFLKRRKSLAEHVHRWTDFVRKQYTAPFWMVPDADSQATAQVGIKTATSGNRRRQATDRPPRQQDEADLLQQHH